MILMVAPMTGGEGVSWATAGGPSITGTESADLVVPLLTHQLHVSASPSFVGKNGFPQQSWVELVSAQPRVGVVA